MSLLSVKDLGVRLAGRAIVDDLSFDVEAGELIALIGPNGAGKSTLLKAIAQILPYTGQVVLDGQPMDALKPRERATRLAYLGQGDAVQWPLAVYDLVSLGRYPYAGGWWAGGHALDATDHEAIRAALEVTDTWSLRTRRFDRLSGGERSRVRLARALAVEAPLLLADEPVASLDPLHQLRVMELLRGQCREGAAAIVVLHDLTLASRFCDRFLLLHEGKTIAVGDVREVMTAANLHAVYGISALVGEHADQPYILPWSCDPPHAGAGLHAG